MSMSFHMYFVILLLKSAVSITIACLNVCALKITGAMGMENIYLDLVMTYVSRYN